MLACGKPFASRVGSRLNCGEDTEIRAEQPQTQRGPGDRRELIGDAEAGDDAVDLVVEVHGAGLRVHGGPTVEHQAIHVVLRQQGGGGDAGRSAADYDNAVAPNVAVASRESDCGALCSEIDGPVVGADRRLDDVAVVQVIRVVGLA